jgi:hypothetical protein
MSDSARRIHSDWFELKEVYDNIFSLDDYLKLETSLLEEARTGLRLSVEEGVLQYKGQLLRAAREFIEALKFDTRHLDQLPRQSRQMSLLLFIILIQRLFTTGQVALSKQEPVDNSVAEEMDEKDIKVIMEELRKMAAADPDFSQRQEVKTILLQFKIYQKELEDLNKLKTSIPREKLPGLTANFQKTFEEINRKIQDNYNQIIQEKIKAVQPPPAPGDLKQYKLNELTPILLKQGETAAKLRTLFLFAGEERFNTRELFETALTITSQLNELFRLERGLMARWEPHQGGEVLVAKRFSEELILRLGKLIGNR